MTCNPEVGMEPVRQERARTWKRRKTSQYAERAVESEPNDVSALELLASVDVKLAK
jgi:hypothetical protein